MFWQIGVTHRTLHPPTSQGLSFCYTINYDLVNIEEEYNNQLSLLGHNTVHIFDDTLSVVNFCYFNLMNILVMFDLLP